MQNKMEVFKAEGMWVVKSDDVTVIDLFGTDTMPTPFNAMTPADKVLEEITRRNPNSVVTLKEATR